LSNASESVDGRKLEFSIIEGDRFKRRHGPYPTEILVFLLLGARTGKLDISDLLPDYQHFPNSITPFFYFLVNVGD
jgi:hypothetical protein